MLKQLGSTGVYIGMLLLSLGICVMLAGCASKPHLISVPPECDEIPQEHLATDTRLFICE